MTQNRAWLSVYREVTEIPSTVDRKQSNLAKSFYQRLLYVSYSFCIDCFYCKLEGHFLHFDPWLKKSYFQKLICSGMHCVLGHFYINILGATTLLPFIFSFVIHYV